MAKLFSDYFGLKHEDFEKLGVFDPVIGYDTHLFLDPHLLKNTQIPEFLDSRSEIIKYYTNIIIFTRFGSNI